MAARSQGAGGGLQGHRAIAGAGAGGEGQPACFSLAVQVKVPPPVLLILRVCAAGLPPPWVAVNESVVGLAPMAGGTARRR